VLTIDDRGARNRVIAASETLGALNGTIVLTGDDNVVELREGCTSENGLRIELGTNCVVRIFERCTLNNMFVWAARDGRLSVGADSGFNGLVRFLLHEPGRVSLGHGCLFAGSVEVSVSDMHSIVDVQSGARINPPADIRLGNRVWVAQDCMILKGSTIGDGSVVGAKSLVRGTLPSYSLCGGVPARVLRDGTSWDFSLLPWDARVVEQVRSGDRSSSDARRASSRSRMPSWVDLKFAAMRVRGRLRLRERLSKVPLRK
jgi:acetyltransferase-like isoleucine patch superfamily enzyme